MARRDARRRSGPPAGRPPRTGTVEQRGGAVEGGDVLGLVPQAAGGEDEARRASPAERRRRAGVRGRCARRAAAAAGRRRAAVASAKAARRGEQRRRRGGSPRPTRSRAPGEISAAAAPPRTASHQVATQEWHTATTGTAKSRAAARAGLFRWTRSAPGSRARPRQRAAGVAHRVGRRRPVQSSGRPVASDVAARRLSARARICAADGARPEHGEGHAHARAATRPRARSSA